MKLQIYGPFFFYEIATPSRSSSIIRNTKLSTEFAWQNRVKPRSIELFISSSLYLTSALLWTWSNVFLLYVPSFLHLWRLSSPFFKHNMWMSACACGLTLWMLDNFLKIDYMVVCFLKPLHSTWFLLGMVDQVANRLDLRYSAAGLDPTCLHKHKCGCRTERVNAYVNVCWAANQIPW